MPDPASPPSPGRRTILGRIGLGLGVAWFPRLRASGAVMPTVSRQDSPWKKALPDGVTVTLVGFSEHPSTDKSWRTPDGNPLADPPIDPLAGLAVGPRAFVFVVRIDGLPEGRRADIQWRISQSNASGSRSPILKDGREIQGVRAIVAGFPEGKETTEIGVRIAAGEFQQYLAKNPKGISQIRTPLGQARFGRAHLVLQETELHTAVTLAHTFKDSDPQFAAIDDQGDRHTPTQMSSSTSPEFALVDLEFRVAPDHIREFELRARPYENVTFGELPLKPKPQK